MLLLLFALLTATLSASTLTVSESGTFDSSIETSSFSSPDDTWSFSFDVDSNPSVSNVSLDNWFDVVFTNFTYTLNGSLVSVTPEDIILFSAAQGGLIDICFTGTCTALGGPQNGFELEGAQIYSGLESSPTILSGSYSPELLDVFVNGDAYGELPGAGPLNITPEPSSLTFLTCGIALLLIMLAGKRNRAKVGEIGGRVVGEQPRRARAFRLCDTTEGSA